jgi:hypothetical protein
MGEMPPGYGRLAEHATFLNGAAVRIRTRSREAKLRPATPGYAKILRKRYSPCTANSLDTAADGVGRSERLQPK